MGSPVVGPIAQGFRKLWPFQVGDTVSGVGAKIQQNVEPLLEKMGLMQRPDTSWHDQQVQQANQSFQPPAQPAPSLSTMHKPLKDK